MSKYQFPVDSKENIMHHRPHFFLRYPAVFEAIMIRETQGTKEEGNNFVDRFFVLFLFLFCTHFEVGLLHY